MPKPECQMNAQIQMLNISVINYHWTLIVDLAFRF